MRTDRRLGASSYPRRASGRAKRAQTFTERAYTVGIGGPVGTGKTALTLALCRRLRDAYDVVAVTNDIFTKEDGEFLIAHDALRDPGRVRAVETGGCPHAAIREDISGNLNAVEELTAKYPSVDVCLMESGGDNLAANYSRELADYIVYVIDVCGGDKIPRKGGPGVTQAEAKLRSIEICTNDLRPEMPEDKAEFFGVDPDHYATLLGACERACARLRLGI